MIQIKNGKGLPFRVYTFMDKRFEGCVKKLDGEPAKTLTAFIVQQ